MRTAEVVLEDHFAADAINGGVAARAGFVSSFDGEAVSELHQLRADFLRKAVMAGTDQVCRPAAQGRPRARRIARHDARRAAAFGGSGPAAAAARGARACSAGDDSPLVIDPQTGTAVGSDGLPLHLRRAQTTRVSIEANAGICRGMLRHRYPTTGQRQELGEEDQ